MNRSDTTSSRRHFLARSLAATGMAVAALPSASSAVETGPKSGLLNVKDFGAVGDGTTLDTGPLQKTIAACARQGGGTVYFPPGRYLSGTLFLKSRVTLHLDGGATLLGSRNLEDYPVTVAAVRSYTDIYTERSLIYGEQLDHIGIEGRGIIDGQGGAFKGPYKVRPYLLRIIGCRDVSVRDVTLKDSPMWVQHYLACDGVCLDGLTVTSRCNANNDGIDIDGCQRVRIANCDIQSGDDAIVLKSTLDRACRNVIITHCLLSSDCNAFKLGTESNGGFENVLLSNCALYDTRLAGLALEVVDGGTLDGVDIANVTMRNVRAPIFIRLGDRARPFQQGTTRPAPGTLRNVNLSNIQAVGADQTGCSITGLPGHGVENVTLSNIRISFAGGRNEGDARRPVPEKPEAYPEHSMFGVLPAFGFYCRHARNLSFQQVDLRTAAPDERPSLICEDVDRLQLFAWRALSGTRKAPVISFKDVRDASIHGCRVSEQTGTYLRVAGKNSARIRLFANELTEAARSVHLSPEVPRGAVIERSVAGR
ncbi:MAG: glycoside hydrolase family 28 protein [Limisphaerales bacterium]